MKRIVASWSDIILKQMDVIINHIMMKRTPFAITIDIDRSLALSLSNMEFELMAAFIADSDDPEQTATNVINCGAKIAWYILETFKKR